MPSNLLCRTANWLGRILSNAESIEHAAYQGRFSSNGRLEPAWTRRLLKRLCKGATYPSRRSQEWVEILLSDRGFLGVSGRSAAIALVSHHDRRDFNRLRRIAEWFAFVFSRDDSKAEMLQSAQRILGASNGGARWMPKLLTRAESYFDNQEAARALADVGFESWVRWLLQDRAFLTAISDPELLIHWEGPAEPMMLPAAPAVNWRVPELLTHGDLARWLDVSPSELLWLGNLEVSWRDGLHCVDADHGDPFSRHYRQTAHRKRFGEARIIEAPLPKLKQLQRRILEDMLAKIPCHDAAHGFVKGRSIRSFAAPHVGSPMVIRIDLRNFFVTIGRHQAAGVFRLAGYPPAVAHALSLLCTTRMSAEMFEELIGSRSQFSRAAGSPTLDQTRRLYTRPHLPQGAPTSPLLANLCAYRLDCRLAALAEKVGGIYTRYADDLAFSADLSPSQAKRFSWHVGAIVMDEGFEVHDRKTKRMRRGTRQRIAGVVVNRHPNVSRQQFDRLKAILHNCARRGPASQNRDGHTNFRAYLTGWVAHVAMLNPARGAKLQQLLQEIDWGEDA